MKFINLCGRFGGYMAAAFVGGVMSAAVGATIPYFTGPQDPSQLQNYLNQLVQNINTQAVLSGFGPAGGGLNQASNSFSVSQNIPYQPIVDGLQVGGASVGGVPQSLGFQGNGPSIAAVGSDTNINIGLDPKGGGLVQYVGSAQWVHQPTVSLCPGQIPNALSGNTGTSSVGPSRTISGYLMILDDRGAAHAVPTC